MHLKRGRLGWTLVACVAPLLATGCAGSVYNESFIEHSAKSTNAWVINEEAKKLEATAPDQSFLKYQQVVRSATIHHQYEYYQAKLDQAAEAMQSSMNRPVSEEETFGLFTEYERYVRQIIDARLGLARVYMNKQAYREARAEVQQAVITVSQIGTAGGMRYLANMELLPKIYHLLIDIETRAEVSGRVHIAKLNKQGLEGYGRSQLATNDRRTNKSLREAQYDFAERCLYFREQTKCTSAVKMMKEAGATAGSTAAVPSEAALVRFQTELLGTTSKGLDLWLTPWGIQSFGQQLVDPRLGADTRGAVKAFATEASAGGTPALQQSAQQVIQAVDALPTVQTTSDPQAIAKGVESFAGVFNAFLAQVQEIKAAK